MKKVECIIRPMGLDSLIKAIEELDVRGLNITQIVGYGGQRGATQFYRGVEYDIKLKEKLKVEIVVEDLLVEELVETIIKATRTDAVGDGKIFIYPIEEAVRIRTGERGTAAL